MRMRVNGSVATRILLGTLITWVVGCSGETSGDAESSAASRQPVAALPERHIALEGQPNFRDIGGYETADGHSVKWREILRSGEMPELTDEDLAKLDTLELRSVVNFLLPEEIAKHGPDRLPEDVHPMLTPITSGRTAELSLEAQRAQRSGDFSRLPTDVNTQIHRILLEDAKEQYANLLRSAADPENRPLAYHCSHGVHRTGTATAILLSALGVPWETIREDYLLSNVYRSWEAEAALTRARQLAADAQEIALEDVDLSNAEAFYILDGSYIDGTLEQAIADYGSMEEYIREGLGISDKEITALRSQLLE